MCRLAIVSQKAQNQKQKTERAEEKMSRVSGRLIL